MITITNRYAKCLMCYSCSSSKKNGVFMVGCSTLVIKYKIDIKKNNASLNTIWKQESGKE